ncbi:MLO-like protein 6 [Corylus avellana]|uniref:MLO-like protein 6 n=1 Tax=Corylus avellana TaxID=13451 RepID=UPI00286A60DF|nr:MLO-like protein 6 [Corylus avellana]
MAGAKGGRSLEETPTWAVALVCFVLVVVSIIIEHIIHLIAQWLTKRRKTALYEALEKIKSELMLLGFISLLLAAGQGPISNICISKALGATWHPCTKKHDTKLNKNEENTTTSCDNGHRRLLTISDLGGGGGGISRRVLAGAGYYDKCADKEKVALVSADGINRLHIFIFVLAVVHVLYCITTLAFCRAKMRKWKTWERETRTSDYQFSHDPERFRFARETSFGRRHLSFWSRSSVLLWIVCFFRQFVRSVPKVDYLTLRHGFIIAHLAPQSQTMFNFQQYIKRSLEEDFKVVVGISPTIWFLAVLFLLSNTHGLYSYLWLPFIPLIIILLVGTKLQVIITKMGLRFQERGEVVKGTPLVQPRDDLFWFNRPHLLLYLIHFVLFQNAFQLAFYAWTWYEFGLKSCFHEKLEDVIIRISMGVLIQFLCSYVTLPLYALVTQMGSTMKPTIFNERVVNAIRKWHQTAKKHIKQSRQSASTPGTPLHSASPVYLLRHYKGDLDSFPTSPRMSGLNIEDCEMGRSHSPSRRHDHGKQGQEERDAHELRPTRAREIDIHSTDFSFEKRWIN